ncbi:class I adenylate-forming enzyme family protein [Paracoccus laeviglucosivorans]|uniref:3-methylmercaptopropionyl-CoA ligase n=1 Tax=Paracoccus laeviglucosivorans TaxID=1197861 RepID=A0A521FBS2_9RHOB|nr:AMP-binding protein [Paracoccus laeviglucosivorans]SMO93647.1 fatty-acyl-CoA synthase/long-chain acyl-CoA synthetase [Paracoccus laeviglucosivorans]
MRPELGGLPFLVGDIVTDNARWAPDSPALIFKGRVRNWAEFARDCDLIAQGLAALGVVRGSRVAVLDRNSDDFVLLGYALARMGAVLIPVNMHLRPAELSYILGNAQALLLLTSPEFLPAAHQALAPIPDPPRILLRGGTAPDTLPWAQVAEGGPPGSPPATSAPESADDPHLVLYTSGTTGRPKGAIISHRRTVLDALAVLPVFGIRPHERFFCYMPLFHTGAWDYLKLYFMQRGAAVIAERFEAETAVQQIETHRCNGMFGVPLVLRQMVESQAWQTADMSSMRLIAYANYDPSALIVRIVDAFRARGAVELGIANAYGLTEGGPYICINRPDRALEKPLSIGHPVPGAQVALLDERMQPVPPGELGEICVRGPALMSGYLNRPEATAEAFAGGWLHTGDLGRVDADGFVHLVDRKKDMIRSGGENIFAKEVEQVLVTHPAVRDCAVVGLPDDDYGERVVAVVVREPDAPAVSADDLSSFVRARLAGFKTPRQVVFVAELPKTPAGKIKKHEIRKAIAAEAPQGAREQVGHKT